MKVIKSLVSIVILFFTINVTAQQAINYKAVIKDSSGNVVANDLIIIQFTILQGAGMTNVYQETHTPITDANGIAIVNIGKGNINNGVFADIDWASDDHFFNVQINTGSGLTDLGTTQFMAVPYAFSAANAATKINDLSDGKSDVDGSSLFLGKDAGLNDEGENNKNVGVGFEALLNNTSGYFNTANGYKTLFQNTTGNTNTANGYLALYSNTIGFSNTANGSLSLRYNNTGSFNTANGAFALRYSTTANYNTAIGASALNFNTTGSENTANGYQALFYNMVGNWNTANGFGALFSNSSGYSNVANGYYALYANNTGYYNTATGVNALKYNKGFENTAIGHDALITTITGDNNIGIGNNAQSSSATANNEVTIGNSSNNVYRMYASSWTNASDRNLKHAIKKIPIGLDFVLKLRPVQFVYNNANNAQKSFGFIAQEVKQTVIDSNLEDNILVSPLNKAYLGLRTTELISVLTKAIQEQQEIIDSQNNDIKSLTAELVDTKEKQNSNYQKLLIRIEQIEATNNQ